MVLPASPRAVIFDLDGTLTEPLLDFELIRREIGLPSGLPILEVMADLGAAERARAEAILRRHEIEAVQSANIADGCLALLSRLDAAAVPYGVITRSVREAVEIFARRFSLQFGAVYTREDGVPKPDPEGVHVLCRTFGVAPAEALAVGDYKFDIIAGSRAGCRTALVRANPPEDLTSWGSPDLVVRSLRDLLPLWRASD